MSVVLRRLKKRRDFLRVAAKGRKWAAPGLVLQACPRPGYESNRNATEADGTGRMKRGTPQRSRTENIGVGFTASRKVGTAVRRNRARRRLRALAHEVLPAEGRPGFDYVLIARAATLDRPFDKLRGDLRTALRKTGATHPRSGEPRKAS